MKITISLIKADIGSIGGHIKPSSKVLETVIDFIKASPLIIDSHIFHTGDDIAILMSHTKGTGNDEIHKLAWDALMQGTQVAKEQGLYGAGQDLLKDSFSGNVKGAGPAVAELEFQERPAEPFLVFLADKTDPGAYNLPFYLGFADPFHNSGLLLSPAAKKGFTFRIVDVKYKDADKYIDLRAPADLYDIAVLLRETGRYSIESIFAPNGEQCAAISTTRLHNIAGKYTGKDDPVALVRVQKDFPATGEILSPFRLAPYVDGFMRGSHIGPLMPSKVNSPTSFFDGPPMVSCIALCVHEGKFTEMVDCFDHPFWDEIRSKASKKAIDIREQGFFGNAMLGMEELEYSGIVESLAELEKKFKIKKAD
ncbi:MAG TPA: fructose-1,6-bisphosphatase [Candidatus Pacearchaeota archaeon]|nr:fructose-1,6-bisphosphatase [Candidatus Pacearchaeota archaeon]